MPSPQQVGTDSTWASVSTGAQNTCATRSDHSLWCWGNGETGAVGDGGQRDRAAPVQIGTALSWSSVSVTTESACGIAVDRSAWCWGANDFGQLGNGSTSGVDAINATPSIVVGQKPLPVTR